ncbi:MAG: methyltransferase, partial [Novosphingobium sp.]
MPAIRTALVLSLALAACAPAQPPRALTPADYAAMLADPAPPAADRARDEPRKPAERLAIAPIVP